MSLTRFRFGPAWCVFLYCYLIQNGYAVVFSLLVCVRLQERQRYLQRKLKTHANIAFSQKDVSEYKALQPNKKSRFD